MDLSSFSPPARALPSGFSFPLSKRMRVAAAYAPGTRCLYRIESELSTCVSEACFALNGDTRVDCRVNCFSIPVISGSILRFTPQVDCVVLYTGRDSYPIRTMPSQSASRGRFERLVDKCVLLLWLCYCALTLVS